MGSTSSHEKDINDDAENMCSFIVAWGKERLPNGFVVMKIQHVDVNNDHVKLHDYFENKKAIKYTNMLKKFEPVEVDKHRMQAIINDSFKSKFLLDLKTRVAKAANVLLPGCHVLECMLIKSAKGGEEQDQHIEFQNSYLEKCVKSGNRAMSAIAPIKNDMKLNFGNSVIACVPGEVIFIDMDTVYGGCSYDVPCFRLCMKFGYDDDLEDAIDYFVGKVHVCQHCNYSSENVHTLRSHIRCCSENPQGEENRKQRSQKRMKQTK